MIQAARDETGLVDFGPGPFEDGLEVLCKSIREEARLNTFGTEKASGRILHALKERLKLQDWFTRHPEILEQDIRRPVFLMGLPRSGTTALAHFLSEDPLARSPRNWEVQDLTPPPDAALGNEDPRYERQRLLCEAQERAHPGLQARLPVGPADSTEHGSLVGYTFRSFVWCTLFRTPSYAEWLLKQDLLPSYEYLAKILKLLQWRCPPDRWNLKYPLDMFALRDIRTVFPDSIILWSHRDPVATIPSVCDLLTTFRKADTDHVDRHELGSHLCDLMAIGVERGMEARDALGDTDIFDVYQADLGANTIETVKSIYQRTGLPLTEDYLRLLDQRLTATPRGHAGDYSYDIADFGLTGEGVRSKFQRYISRFGLAEGRYAASGIRASA
ncbi:hypothetical protein GGQ88_002200 [Novosphingobium hassiacum]|uniref:Sulfotransferase n=1 Tax=Novosphingobium hassiacum TaxID=173676 RepID=A0A7W5ZVY8_9SPHN|nr:sulfotransferase [Novosphingobium hassiacum]MBB3860931.1 hypothetical protein [Novosphingobium hassiacum]